MINCLVKGCDRPRKVKQMCKRHYANLTRYGYAIPTRDLETPIELMERIGWTVTETGCWEWNGARNDSGYGVLNHTKQGFNNTRVHRVSISEYGGIDPDNWVVRHKCDNPPCMNPDHLELGTQADNSADMMSRGRHHSQSQTYCPNGHDRTLPGATKMVTKHGRKTKICVLCDRERKRKWHEKDLEQKRSERASRPFEIKTHCKNGHDLYIPGATIPPSGKNTSSTCRECNRESGARTRAKKRAENQGKSKLCRNGHDVTLDSSVYIRVRNTGPYKGNTYRRCKECEKGQRSTPK